MTINDFENRGKSNNVDYITKERFWFENDVVKFWYRYIITSFEYQPSWNGEIYETKYQLLMIPDDDSIHDSLNKDFMKVIRFGYLLRERIKKGKTNEAELEKLANSIEKIKIEPKIKVDKYQKIKGIISGETFYI